MVCYANDPKKRGYTTLAPALDLTTSLRGDFAPITLQTKPCNRHRACFAAGIANLRSNLALFENLHLLYLGRSCGIWRGDPLSPHLCHCHHLIYVSIAVITNSCEEDGVFIFLARGASLTCGPVLCSRMHLSSCHIKPPRSIALLAQCHNGSLLTPGQH